MRRHALSIPLFVLALSGGAASGAWPQALELASRGPRFIAAWKPSEAVDVSNAVVLRRRVSLDLTNVTADEALKEITRQADLEISYSKALLPSSKSVSLHAREITVAAALTEVLLDAEVDVAVARGGHMALVRRPSSAGVEVQDSGAIVGTVTDKATGAPIPGATVVLEGTQFTATTSSEGRYRIDRVEAGTYTMLARYIGYAVLSTSVTLAAEEEVTADFALVKSVQRLDEVVTTGTVVPTPVKALPVPVTLITAEDIALRQPHTFQQIIRQFVPTAVSWDNAGSSPISSTFQLRGATALTGPGGGIKILVDGVEAARHLDGGVDPNSIERIEVIRGPQSAAIYGSDGMGGVIQIFTKRGASNHAPRVSAEAALGVMQTPYAGYDSGLRQDYTASVSGGGADASYNLGGGYFRLGDYVPEGGQSNYSAYGGMHFAKGPLTADVSGRYFVLTQNTVFSPDLLGVGIPFFSKPFAEPTRSENQTIGAHLGLTPTPWWRHELTVGVDRHGYDMAQTDPRLTSPDDTLLALSEYSEAKTSFRYNTSVQHPLAANVLGSLSLGFDHYRLLATNFGSGGLLATAGGLQPAPGNSIFGTRNITTNTGYFAQAQLGFRDALFLTAGLRAEENSNFGDDLGTPLSPRFGASYVRELGGATVKFRGSWGRGIRAPGAGLKTGSRSSTGILLSNPLLRPQRQDGWDAGIDMALGSGGSLGVTYYDQTAEDLIQSVLVSATPLPTRQFQNVGRVQNTGLELEGWLAVGPVLQLRAHYGYSRSRVEQLPPGYTGDLRVGDQVHNIPRHTAGASATITPFRTMTLTAGLAYVGSREFYDHLAYYRCLGSTGPCRNETFALDRDYLISYPSFVKLDATISQQLGPSLSGFMRVRDLTNNSAFEFSDVNVVTGRTTTIGLRFDH